MRLGLGCTALARGRLSGHVDGIGVYTSELLKYVNSSAGLTNADHGVNNQVLCTVFGKKYGAARTTDDPGSAIAGMPASEIKPISDPVKAAWSNGLASKLSPKDPA